MIFVQDFLFKILLFYRLKWMDRLDFGLIIDEIFSYRPFFEQFISYSSDRKWQRKARQINLSAQKVGPQRLPGEKRKPCA